MPKNIDKIKLLFILMCAKVYMNCKTPVLIILSVILTLLGGIVPSKKAAKEDPVTALRTD